MTLEELLAKFELFVDAPDSVASLRVLVRQLAVQGRLINQHPEDEPARILLATISEDRAAFVKSRRLGRQKVFTPAAADECPFPLPIGWAWTRLGNLCWAQAGFAFKSAAFIHGESGVPIIRIRDITKERTQINYVGEYREEFLVETGDYLVGMDGNFIVAMWRGPRALLNQRVSRLQWYSHHLEPSFLAIAAQHRLSELQGTKAYTTVDHLSSSQIENVVVPLPPLAEQKRIVAKVDELMALCDRLEAQQKERETRHAALARASLTRFADAPTPANLTFLFHKSFTIPPADLRKSILTLAVQGKLVPQDTNDEPASRALARLAELGGNAKVRRSVPVNASKSDSVDEENLPTSWVIESTARLLHLGAIRDLKDGNHGANHPKVAEFTETGLPFITATQVSDDGAIDYDGAYKVSGVALNRLRVGFAKPGDVIYTHKGSVGRVAICTRECVLSPQTTYYRTNDEIFTGGFVRTFLRSPLFTKQVDSVKRQTTRDFVSINAQYQFFLRVPPLAEQRRIVAKVDQLMAFVDQMETQLAASRAKAAKLLDAIVGELTA